MVPVIIYIIIINIMGFFIMGIDKYKAVHHKRRISEKMLFIIALLFGSPGSYMGMRFFHHKTKHMAFSIGFPVILIIQILIITLTYVWPASI